VPRKPRLIGGVKGHNIKRDYLAGKRRRACPVLTGWAGSFTISETVNKSPEKHEVFLRAPLFIEQFNLPLSPLFSCHGDFYILEMLNDPKVG
jgi:hypothetical protein